jgi:lipopolysaccharide biosynthesis regulator YciM
MEILYWWLISLPVFFALGWLAARIDLREVLREAKSLPRAFAESYRQLVSANAEGALHPFQGFRLPENASFELLMSLGLLYRRQGYFAEAIRLHEQLHGRLDLSIHEMDEVVWELSQDYLKAGMLDRTMMCIQALKTPERLNQSVLVMMNIFQAQKQWDKALEYASKVNSLLGLDEHRQASHFHCEMAIRAHQRMDAAAVAHHLNKAEQDNPRNVRIPMLRGDFALANKAYAQAIDHWKSIEHINAHFLYLVIDKMHEAFAELSQHEEEKRLLMEYFTANPSAPLLEKVHSALGQRLSAETLLSWVNSYEKPLQSWQTVHLTMNAFIYRHGQRFAEALPILQRLEKMALMNRPQHYGFVCDHCGFLLQNHVWRCPGCDEWDSYAPMPRALA